MNPLAFEHRLQIGATPQGERSRMDRTGRRRARPQGNPGPLTPLEIVAGFPNGDDLSAPELPAATGASPLAAMERAVLPALRRPPCVVSFSGGRDSSAVLAVAANVARRYGLPPPVPVTLRFPDAPRSQESEWQERVVKFLGLGEWTRLNLTDELDWVGPVAGAVLREHGVVWPPNTHFHQPILEVARGGSLLTGIDGDTLLGGWRWARVIRMLTGTTRPEGRDLLRVLQAFSPPAVRAAVDNHRYPDMPSWPWLRPEAARAIARRWNADAAREPVVWQSRIRWVSRHRILRLTIHSMDLMAARSDVLALHPLADPAFLSALAAGRRWRGYPDRAVAMSMFFGSILPPEVVTRSTKALFNQAFSHRHTRQFATCWSGVGVDASLVDVEMLRALWSTEAMPPATALLLQTAWLASQDGGLAAEEPAVDSWPPEP